MLGKPGISSFDKFAIGNAIKTEIAAATGGLFGLNNAVSNIVNGDKSNPGSYDDKIGTRAVKKASERKIGGTASSKMGGVGPMSTPARTANLLGNPYMRRYEDGNNSTGPFNFGLPGSPMIGEYFDVYESESDRVRFMDATVGKDLLGYTHMVEAAKERSDSEENDNLYLKGTYSIFSNLQFPFDEEDIEVFKEGPKRYSPSEPYLLRPLEDSLMRRLPDGSIQKFTDKFEAFVPGRELYHGSLLDMWDYMGSGYYLNLLNGAGEYGLFVENYPMEQKIRAAVYDTDSIQIGDYRYFLDVNSISPDKEIKGLLGKTNRMFYDGKIRSLVNRFATLNFHNEGSPDFLNSATDHLYGLSRGRNLRKLDLTYENGYPNPYCRVWTTHYQYSKYKHLIRDKWPGGDKNVGDEHYTFHEGDELMRPHKGHDRLTRMSSLDPENGKPIFSPYYVDDRRKMAEDSIKRCMFSIENLAWKDVYKKSAVASELGEWQSESNDGGKESDPNKISYIRKSKALGATLTKEQRGPNGGRIMWFPPYNLKFNERISARWNGNEFIGRGEKVYSYVNAERGGNLSFSIIIDHPSVINEWAKDGKFGKTGGKADPLSKDEMILRYFAGCDSLDFEPRKAFNVIDKKYVTTTIMTRHNSNKMTITEKIKPEEVASAEQMKSLCGVTFCSVFFYPNDYACEDYVTSGTGNEKLKADPKKFAEGLELMFDKGDRKDGSGSVIGQGYEKGIGGSGMTYNGGPFRTCKNKINKTNNWYYPVDGRVDNEVLGTINYQDTSDFGLNLKMFGGEYWSDNEVSKLTPTGENNVIDYLNKGNTYIEDSENLKKVKGTLGESIKECKEDKYFIPSYNFFKNLSRIIPLLDSASKNNFKYEVTINGYASKHGYTDSNQTLSENRAKVIEGWLKSLKVFEDDKIKIKYYAHGEIPGTNKGTVSALIPKSARAASVMLKIIPGEVDIAGVEEKDEITITTTTSGFDEENSVVVYSNGTEADDYENNTYDDEYTYFKRINENDDIVKRYISDKIDYFDPAFHSISPEGFNARLTFLQQCARQGPTISASDASRGSSYGAGNLSFGRPPFCVLRIGDFFNTKICIESINIHYDNNGAVQWDMNPEGAGMQPMIANVDISFTFLGGSDLSGPISRLQNAVSYNYYANTSVYDRRADYRENFSNEEDDTAMSWSPLVNRSETDDNITGHVPYRTIIRKDK